MCIRIHANIVIIYNVLTNKTSVRYVDRKWISMITI